MRKALLCALMTALLPLSLCSCNAGAGIESDMQKIQDDFLVAETINLTADITADYGERVYDYKISFSGLPDNGMITIIEPEAIAGASVLLTGDESTLEFDGAQVYTGEILPDGLSPVDAMPVMVSAWREGLITESVRESYGGESCIAALFRITDDVGLRTWFGCDSGLPLYAEAYFDGYTVLSCTFYNVKAE